MDEKVLQTGPLITHAQQRLLELGFASVDTADGKNGFKTQGAILSFRNRNGLPLSPLVDDDLVRALDVASKIVLPAEQTQAEPVTIGRRVAAMRHALWARTQAAGAAVTTVVTAVVLGIINNLGDAINALTPLKTFLNDQLSGVNPLTIVAVSAGGVAVVSLMLYLTSRRTEQAIAGGYRVGSIKNDLPGAPPT